MDGLSRENWSHEGSKPIIDIEDEYEHPDPTLEYILTNILYNSSETSTLAEFKELEELYSSIYTNNCDCTEDFCESQKTCPHGGNYKIYQRLDDGKELVLSENRPCKDLIYECFEYCRCISTCNNRLVQYGPRKNLKIVDISYNGIQQKGLTSIQFIPKGAFICEYAGEILTKSEASLRLEKNRPLNKMNYIICLNERSANSTEEKAQTFIDPSQKGNIGRYLNHSCDPNCEILSVRIGNPVPHLGIYAKRDIAELEELCFHYGGEQRNSDGNNRMLCYCGSKNCERFLPNFNF